MMGQTIITVTNIEVMEERRDEKDNIRHKHCEWMVPRIIGKLDNLGVHEFGRVEGEVSCVRVSSVTVKSMTNEKFDSEMEICAEHLKVAVAGCV